MFPFSKFKKTSSAKPENAVAVKRLQRNQIACLKVNYLNQGIRTAERITLSKILLKERKIEIGL